MGHIIPLRRVVSLCLLSLMQASALMLVSCINPSVATPAPPSAFDNSTDHLALLSFKSLISSDPSGALASWNRTLHFCGWLGITCSRRHPQRVVALDLERLDLVGNLSPSLANLTFLRRLNLSSNQFGGSVPPEFGRLLRLRHLDLNSNSLTGEIPANLSQCANLRLMNIRRNMIMGEIPSDLGSLAHLQVMRLSLNNITGRIPPSMGNLSSAITFHLGFNHLEGNIPEELGGITGLQYFTLAFNMLSGSIPPSLFNFSSLRVIHLAHNQLSSTLTQDLGCHLPQLEELYIYDNQFGGHIPSSFPNATRLSRLELGDNNFEGVVPSNFGTLQSLSKLHLGENQLEAADWAFLSSLTNCSQLKELYLSNNKLQGTLPSMAANLSRQLQWLDISNNRISGDIPSDIGKLVNLLSLVMDGNLLTGTIPYSVGSLRNLTELGLSHNKLSGKIPSSLGNLTRLTRLWLGVNELEGRIPTSFRNYTFLELMDLYQNRLSGEIPGEAIGLRSLSRYLDLSLNFFTGSIPTEVGSLQNLQTLDISENKLSGEVPTSLGDCEILEYLFMGGNSLQGSIPSSLSKLRGLRVMDLSRNQFFGIFPAFLQSLPTLQLLNLSFNDFEGEVPKGGVFSNHSAYSVLGNQKLCGGDPKLHLQGCPVLVSRKKHGPRKLTMIVAIFAASVVCLIFFFMFARCRRILSSRKDSPPMASLIDTQYPRISYWELLKATHGFSKDNLLGQGSFGSVYKGVLDEGAKLVAVKVFNLQQHGALRTFMRECGALRNIQHRNLLKIVTSCSSLDRNGNDFMALVFEFMPNGSLEYWLHAGECSSSPSNKLNFAQRLNIAIDVASALDYLHNHCETPIVHCDLKPSNILFDYDMCGHVSDFGLSRFILENGKEQTKSPTSSICIKGTVGYIAPEYGTGSQPDTLGDVYSYGILLLEMFIGKRPTDELFHEGLNLHKYVDMAFPTRVLNIVDPCLLLLDEYEGANHNILDVDCIKQRLLECLVSVIEVGLLCSKESPEERIQMRDVVKEMSTIRDVLREGKERF